MEKKLTKQIVQREERCNICGCEAKLTADHIPPKFWNNKDLKYYSQGLGTKDPKRSNKDFPHHTPNGIVFRSICKNCNNNLLGYKTDQPLKEFVEMIMMEASNNVLFHASNYNIYVNRVARAVIGHMLAAKEFYDDQTIVDIKLRGFFLDMEALPPRDMRLYYFFYPYDYIVIARDIIPLRNDKESSPFFAPNTIISCIYSYPIAFILVDKETNDRIILPDMFSLCTKDIDEKKEVPFDFSSFLYPHTYYPRHFAWPLNVFDGIDGAMGIVGGEATKSIIIAKGVKSSQQRKKWK